MTKRMAAAVFILSLVGSGALAYAAEMARPFPDTIIPAEIARKRFVRPRPLVLGDLKPASEVEAEALLRHASNDREMLDKCVEVGNGVVQWSERGTSLELAPPWGWAAATNVATAYCDDGIVLLGGTRKEAEDGELRTWLFYWIRIPGQEFGPVSILAHKSYSYTLKELKAIDPISRQLLFSGIAADGREVLLSARFAILPRR